MPALDPTAPRKKYGLLKFVRRYNLRHPLKRIARPAGFKPETKRVGDPAREFVRNMQRRVGLKVTGKFDEPTMLRLFPPGVRSRVMAKVHSQLGVHEWPSGSNRGPVVKYLNATGLGGGYPWCAAFVTWILKQCGFKKFPPNPASAHSWAVWAKSKGITKPISKSKKGDLWVWEWGNGDGMYDHIGFCDDSKPGDATAYYIDGNVGAYGGAVTEASRSGSSTSTSCGG
jgi:hypothetical protein